MSGEALSKVRLFASDRITFKSPARLGRGGGGIYCSSYCALRAEGASPRPHPQLSSFLLAGRRGSARVVGLNSFTPRIRLVPALTPSLPPLVPLPRHLDREPDDSQPQRITNSNFQFGLFHNDFVLYTEETTALHLNTKKKARKKFA